MRLIVIDSDESYLKRLQFVVSKSQELKVDIHTFLSLNQLLSLPNSIMQESVILIHEALLVEGLKLLEAQKASCPNLDIFVLSDGLVEEEFQGYVFRHPLIGKEIYNRFITKYQPVDQLLKEIKGKYMMGSTKDLLVNTGQSKIISVYSPIKKMGDSKRLERTISKLHKEEKKLIIHLDPYFGLMDSEVGQMNPFNLSYLFTMVKRKKRNLNFLLDEMGDRIRDNCFRIYGPINMLDIDCLNASEVELFFLWLKGNTMYDRIYVNICGVHITRFLRDLIGQADEKILVSEQSKIIERVIQQFPYDWQIKKDTGFNG